jgi:F-box protein 9
MIAAAAQVAPDPVDETPTSTDVVSSAAPVEEPYSFQRHIQVQPDYEKPPILPAPLEHPPPTVKPEPNTISRLSPLTSLLSKLPIPADQITFLPADENLPLPLAGLPLELLDPILSYLDVASIERFALTCWRARYVTSRTPKWKRVVEGLYKPPGVLPPGMSVKDLDVMRRYTGEWRTALMEEERVRMDGCYISVCHYM